MKRLAMAAMLVALSLGVAVARAQTLPTADFSGRWLPQDAIETPERNRHHWDLEEIQGVHLQPTDEMIRFYADSVSAEGLAAAFAENLQDLQQFLADPLGRLTELLGQWNTPREGARLEGLVSALLSSDNIRTVYGTWVYDDTYNDAIDTMAVVFGYAAGPYFVGMYAEVQVAQNRELVEGSMLLELVNNKTFQAEGKSEEGIRWEELCFQVPDL